MKLKQPAKWPKLLIHNVLLSYTVTPLTALCGWNVPMNGTMRKQFDYFLKHHTDLVERYNGRVVVIYDEQVDGDYETELEALNAAKAKHELGTFIVQKVSPGKEAYTQTFHSRVMVA